jgi:hypothetical protein
MISARNSSHIQEKILIPEPKKSASQDQIYRLNGETLNVKIIKISPTTTDYYLKGDESIINQEFKSNLLKIVYASGREEIFTKKKADELGSPVVLFIDKKMGITTSVVGIASR